MKRIKYQPTAVILLWILLIIFPQNGWAIGYLGEQDFEQLTYQSINLPLAQQLAAEIKQLCHAQENKLLIIEKYQQLDHIKATALANDGLLYIWRDQDTTDENVKKQYLINYEQLLTLQALCTETVEVIANSPVKELVANHQQFQWALEEEETSHDLALQKLHLAEEELLSQYHDVYYADEAVYIEQKRYTAADLSTLEQGSPLYQQVAEKLSSLRKQKLAEIYCQLVKLRTEEAKLNGYDNYYDYIFQENYGRDYTPKDCLYFYQEVKTHLAPLEELFNTQLQLQWPDVLPKPSEENILPLLQEQLTILSPHFAPAMTYLQVHQLYDIEQRKNKRSGGYTLWFNEINQPFLYSGNDSDFLNLLTVIHEFGHFNAYYQLAQTVNFSQTDLICDLAEIHSQGLEILMLPYYEALFGADNFQWAQLYTLDGLLYSITSGCLIAEFEQRIYENPTMTSTQMEQLMADLEKQYHLLNSGFSKNWTETTHLFETPGYYISYATSAFSAWEIWTESQKDMQQAVKIYEKLLTQSIDNYLDVLKTIGLKSPFAVNSVKNLARQLEDYFSEKYLVEINESAA